MSVMASELVSVVIPLYNKELHIAATLESIIAQDYDNIEIIVVDDASNDSSHEISERILSRSNRKFRVITHNVNRGKSVARNTGLEASYGKYVWFCDADDLARRNLVSSLVAVAQKYDSDISFGGYTKHFENGVADEQELITIDDPQPLNNEQALYMRMVNKVAPHLCTTMFRRSMIEKYNLRYYEGCTAFQDVEFQLKAFCHAEKVSYVKDSLYVYVHSNEMGAVRENNTNDKDLRKYIDSTDAHYRAAEYISKHTKSERVKFIADNMLIPEAVIRRFTICAKANDREKFYLLLKDATTRNILRTSRRVLFINPEIYMKALMILYMPDLYFKLRKKG